MLLNKFLYKSSSHNNINKKVPIYIIIGTRSKWELMGQRIDIKCIVV